MDKAGSLCLDGVVAASPVRPGREATLEETELELVRSTLAATQGNISEASKRLGVSRNTTYRKLRRARAESS